GPVLVRPRRPAPAGPARPQDAPHGRPGGAAPDPGRRGHGHPAGGGADLLRAPGGPRGGPAGRSDLVRVQADRRPPLPLRGPAAGRALGRSRLIPGGDAYRAALTDGTFDGDVGGLPSAPDAPRYFQ